MVLVDSRRFVQPEPRRTPSERGAAGFNTGPYHIPSSGTGTNSLIAIPGGGDPRRFFAIIEKDTP
jgi:hypothetical protein